MTDEELCSLAQEGDPAALDLLIARVLPSIRLAANRVQKDFTSLQIDPDDLQQEALIGILRAVRTFRSDKGILFQTYASSVADNAMLDYIRTCRAGIPASGPMISLDAPPPGFDSENGSYAEILLNSYSQSPENIYIKKETISEVRTALQMISIRERTYLHYRYGFIDDMEHNIKETANHFHLSASRARNIEKSALRNCRKQLPFVLFNP